MCKTGLSGRGSDAVTFLALNLKRDPGGDVPEGSVASTASNGSGRFRSVAAAATILTSAN